MNWLALMLAAVKLLGSLADYLREKKLLDAGEATAIAEGQREILLRVQRVKAAREALADPQSDRDDRLRDRFRRD